MRQTVSLVTSITNPKVAVHILVPIGSFAPCSLSDDPVDVTARPEKINFSQRFLYRGGQLDGPLGR
jgi:hypothetical protein